MAFYGGPEDRAKDQMWRQRVATFCTPDEQGRLVRGIVTEIHCPSCKSQRWDDGTPCHRCGQYPRPEEIKMPKGGVCSACGTKANRYVFSYLACEATQCADTIRNTRKFIESLSGGVQ